MEFVKGHGTGNDFIIVPDEHGELTLTPAAIAAMCDRHRGIGADGVLRVVRSDSCADAQALATDAEWFMDYRNSDGSIAEMCGNGARVFARYLLARGWASGDFTIATRAGVHAVHQEADGAITVDMGLPALGIDGPDPIVRANGREWTGDAWWMPNPHAVVFVDDVADAGTLIDAPEVTAGARFPDGQNVEFIADRTSPTIGPGAQMRVFERGVGETQSCGTGVCAAALSVRRRHGLTGAGSVAVDIPGGRLIVTVTDGGRILLSGPAVLVGQGRFDDGWLREIDG